MTDFRGIGTGFPSSLTFTKTISASVTFTTLFHSRQRSAVTVTFTVMDVVDLHDLRVEAVMSPT